MKIRYIAPIDRDVASHRYRVLIPAQVLANQGDEVTVGKPEEGVINVYGKHFNMEFNLESIERTGGVFDVCDDHFQTEDLADYYKAMCKHADLITCNSEAMRRVILDEAGRDALVIEDPYEFDELEPTFHDLSMGLWFGNKQNMHVLQGQEMDCDLEVVSKFDHPERRGYVRLTPWSRENMEIAFRRNEFAIFPEGERTRKSAAKSNNRIVNAIRGGLLCFCHPLPYLGDLEQFCIVTDDILPAIQVARASNDRQGAADLVRAGQAHIRTKYSPEAVAEKWKGAFHEAEHRMRNQEN